MRSTHRLLRGVYLLALLAGLAACSSTKLPPMAPVEDRGTAVGKVGAPAGEAQAPAEPAKPPLPGAENAGKFGYYTVKPGDTLIRIGLEHGYSWRDIVHWNQLDNPNRIEVGQVLRVIPPGTPAPAGSGSESEVVARPIVVPPPPVAAPLSAPGASSAVAAAVPAASAAAAAPAAVPGNADLGWIWPASGAVIAGFDETKNKGLDLGGKAGDPVYAASDGRVVYAGAGLRGYGNLIILKHDNTFLSAYAHNQTLLVKEDQAVRKGQKIAEMGSSDADRVKLHFEIRRQGKPVDPARYLPAR